MDAKTLQALEDSIKHWESNVKAETPGAANTGCWSCALCGLFIDACCKGCPVAEHTGGSYCMGTPYGFADEALLRWTLNIANRETFRIAAQAELDFLISLRPEKSND